MQKPLLRFGLFLVLGALVCFFFVRSNLREERRRQAELWAQTTGRATVEDVSLGDIFKFDALKGGTQILAYAGVALGAGGILCLLGGAAASMASKPKALPPPPPPPPK